MALIKCSECGKDISEKAKKCPHCGVKPKKKPKNKLTHILKITIAIILLIAIIVTIIVVIIKQNQKFKLYNNTVELGQEDTIKELTNEDNIYIKNGYSVTLKNNNIDINNLGTYEATFELKGEGNITEIIKKIKVVDTTPPTVKLNKDTVYVGDEINLEELVTITDFSQEEALTFEEAKVEVVGNLNTSEEGLISVGVHATDKNGNTRKQAITLHVKNPIVNLYDYIQEKLKGSNFSDGSYDNSFVIKYNDSYSGGLSSQGWINFTEKTAYEYTKYKILTSTTSYGAIKYFDDAYNLTKVYTSSNFSTNNLILNSYLNKGTDGFKLETGDISNYSITSDIERINTLLNNKGQINLVNKTLEQLKSETIDLRTLE